jgi:[ribosomal protein S5]-alanine N-acetyltransferase
MAMTVLEGRRLVLKTFDAAQIHSRYLGWLSDPIVNEYSRRQQLGAVTADAARAYLDGLRVDEEVLGIHWDTAGHVGNIKYGPIDHDNDCADVSILIGEHSVWGHGVGSEAVYLVARHLFLERGLHRIDAGSSNPAFLKLVERLGWSIEGVLRERIKLPHGYRDHTLVGLLAHEFRRRAEFEPVRDGV